MSFTNFVFNNNGEKIANWDVTEPLKAFTIDFLTLDPDECMIILKIVLAELELECRK